MNKKNYQICSRLVMDTSDPSIEFNAAGESNHYTDFVQNILPDWDVGRIGRERLEKIVDKIKQDGRGKEFDCLVGLSGGLDSSYMLHVMVKDFGLRPLVFHVDGGWNSELAVHNINVLIEKLKLDLYTEVINWDEMRDFQVAMFRSGVPHIDIPQDHAFIAVLYRFAEKYKIKYILNGGNISTESVRTPLQYFYWGTDLSQINDIRRRFCSNSMSTYPFSSIFYHKLYLRYFRGVKVVKPLNFMPYLKTTASKILYDEYGWRSYPQKHFESRFTRFYEGYWLPTRFSFDVRRVQFSSLILSEQITRDAALAALRQPPYDPELLLQDIDYIVSKLGLSAEELRGFHEMERKFYWNYRNDKRIFDIGERVLSALTGARRGGAR